MSITAKVGERTYEFETKTDLDKARELYAHHIGSQNSFEELLEDHEIDFYIEGTADA